MSLVLAITVAVLYGTGAYLLLQRNLSRIVIGLGVLGHGANLLLLMAGGRAGRAPILGDGTGPYADPLPQALALTAIVITFSVSAYLLALVYRSWIVTHSDEVEDDVEDRRIAGIATRLAAVQDRMDPSDEATP
ncbi:MAG TPA: Na(+)/H(+) antiporter subunit C [Acidimicrobiia bacterium]|nr:Na(+)/H(+) antiporter subunit C [Acidimicrobiia bacterium]